MNQQSQGFFLTGDLNWAKGFGTIQAEKSD